MLNLTLAIMGALIYRWRGSEFNIRPLAQAAFALPYALATPVVGEGAFIWLIITLAVCIAHGRGLSLEKPYMVGEPEKFEILISWLQPHMSVYWYKVLILSVTGLLITLPAGIATLNPLLALSGLLKGPCYALSFKLGFGTEGGEYSTGFVLYAVLSCFLTS